MTSFLRKTTECMRQLFIRGFVHVASLSTQQEIASQADDRRFDVFLGLNIFVCESLRCQRIPHLVSSKKFISPEGPFGFGSVSTHKKAFFEPNGPSSGFSELWDFSTLFSTFSTHKVFQKHTWVF